MERETVTNRYDIPIVKCCASCKHKDYEDYNNRKCTADGDKKVKPDHVCKKWEMDEKLNLAGRGGGGIKKKEYLKFVIDNITKGSLEEMQKEFEDTHGSIYAVRP